jgi:hypothetical protein
MSKFIKLRFIQATELAGVGYSPVGGPDKNGVYPSVPVAATENDSTYESLVQAGLIEQLGDGDEAGAAKVDNAEMAAFKASGLTETDWLAIPPVDRGQLVAHERQAEETRMQEDIAKRNAEASAKGKETLAADTAAQNAATEKAAKVNAEAQNAPKAAAKTPAGKK